MAYKKIREESQKLKVAANWFPEFDCTDIIKRIDFAVKIKRDAESFDFEDEYLLWAEAKQQPTDVYQMLAQLILTIKADAYDRVPPKFIGCFDCEKIAFIEYHYVLPIYALNDFNWTQTPSAVDDKTVETVRNTIDENRVFTFYFDADRTDLKKFIKANFKLDANTNLFTTLIDKNNFIFVYQKWQKMVKPFIAVDWDFLKKDYSIYDRDFFLAELNIDDNGTVEITDDKIVNKDFYITFRATENTPYQLVRNVNRGLFNNFSFGFKKDGLKHYTDFWKRYKRPPQNEYWDYIVERVDLLVPQDVRERKGSYFTPQIWVELSQQYLAKVLGENWQDEYYIWDCCAGTGNMEVGLTNKYNVWASTIDQQDVDIVKDQITKKGFNLLENHVFQFDFLNDDFNSEKVPADLKKVLSDPEKRKKLIIYINPPYAEVSTKKTDIEGKKSKTAVNQTQIHQKYTDIMGTAGRELFTQFLTRIYLEIRDAYIADFSTLKVLQGSAFDDFRKYFKAELKSLCLMPANTFDNVKGQFPIGFFVWNTQSANSFDSIIADVYDKDANLFTHKKICTLSKNNYINAWISGYKSKDRNYMAYLDGINSNDFQHNNHVYVVNTKEQIGNPRGLYIFDYNLIECSIYNAVRHVFIATWLNDRDQFLYPNDGWKIDAEFQTNCLIYTLFHVQNKITATQGINHWIPFTESEVNAKERFDSHFMSDFLAGKIKAEKPKDLFSGDASAETQCIASLQFTDEAKAVLDAGRELWRYYHEQPDANVNASLYDIKEYFKGRDEKGRMKNYSDDAQYNELFDNLQFAMKRLGAVIRPKVYEYGFLK